MGNKKICTPPRGNLRNVSGGGKFRLSYRLTFTVGEEARTGPLGPLASLRLGFTHLPFSSCVIRLRLLSVSSQWLHLTLSCALLRPAHAPLSSARALLTCSVETRAVRLHQRRSQG